VGFKSEKECDDSLKDAIQNPMTPTEYQAAAKATRKAKMRPLSMPEMTKRTAESQCVVEMIRAQVEKSEHRVEINYVSFVPMRTRRPLLVRQVRTFFRIRIDAARA